MVIGQPNFLICDKQEQHKMADKAEVVKWFAGREVEVLDDQKGRTTVSALNSNKTQHKEPETRITVRKIGIQIEDGKPPPCVHD